MNPLSVSTTELTPSLSFVSINDTIDLQEKIVGAIES
jgi:hypothetical protein